MFPLTKKQAYSSIPLRVRTRLVLLNRELDALIQLSIAARHKRSGEWVEFRRLLAQLPPEGRERVFRLSKRNNWDELGERINELQDEINNLYAGAELSLNEIRSL